MYAEPELLNKNLTADDKYIIIASDGVWEFLTNQAVVNMVDSFKSPLKACKAVVQESYKLWLQYDVRTDDITMIALYLEEMDGVTNAFLEEEKKLAKEGAAADAGGDPRRNSLAANLRRQSVSRKGSAGGWDAIRRVSAVGISLGKSVVEGEQQRPVRRVMTKEKRQVVTSASAEDGSFNASGKPEEGWGFKVLGKVSGEKEVEEIRAAVATNFLLSHLNAAQQKEVFSAMERCETKAKDVVIEKGQPGDWFYVVHSGAYDVVIEGNVVFSYSVDEGGGSNPSFGELALLYSKPRAASIVTSAAGKLWRLHRSTFSEIVMRSSSQKLIKTLRSVEVLKFLSISQLQRLQDALSEVTVEAGKKVITQGEPGKEFYVIMEGKAKVTISSPPHHHLTPHRTPHLTPYPSHAGDDLVARRAKGARGDAARRVRLLWRARPPQRRGARGDGDVDHQDEAAVHLEDAVRGGARLARGDHRPAPPPARGAGEARVRPAPSRGAPRGDGGRVQARGEGGHLGVRRLLPRVEASRRIA